MAVTKLTRKEKQTKLKDEDKISILNTLQFLDEVIVGNVLNKIVDVEQKISAEDYSKISFSSSTLNGATEEGKKEIEKMLDARAKEVKNGINNFKMDYKLSLKNNDNDNIGIFNVKKDISFVDNDKLMLSYDLSTVNNDDNFKIIFDELRNEYKKLETFDLEKIVEYMRVGILEMYNRATLLSSKPN